MTDYTDLLNTRSNGMISRKAQNLDVDLVDIFEGIDWTADAENDAYFSKLIAARVLKTTELTRRKAQERLNGTLYASLGCVPGTAMEFVESFATKMNTTVNWKGAMKVGASYQTIIDLKRVMRIKAAELKLGFDRGDVDDATEQFFEKMKAERPALLNAAFSVRQSFDWDAFARAYFKETDDIDYPLIVAILKKFIHQARLKLDNRKVFYHLMPVLHGPQGCGKTFLLERMLRPVQEACSWSNFEQITDDRNLALWQSLVIVLDEMARAAKADTETIKHVITAETLDRRPMRSNDVVAIPNRAVLIGASNHRLDELIKDETGNRRFVELMFNSSVPADYIDTVNFEAMWCSVQPDDADPLEGFRDELITLQKTNAVMGPVQDWLESGKADKLFRASPNGVSTADLYDSFKNHRYAVTSGIDYQARNQNAFASELRRVTDQYPVYQIRKSHTKQGNRWICEKPFLSTLTGGAAA